MQIYFLRHGDAEDQQPGETDAERDLTDLGRRQANAWAKWFIAHDIQPGALMVSPLNRAVQMAEPTAAALDLELKIDDRLSGGHLSRDSLDGLIADAGDPDIIMLVGHEPDFSEVIGKLTGGNVHQATGACSMVQTDRVTSGDGSLEFLIPPDLL